MPQKVRLWTLSLLILAPLALVLTNFLLSDRRGTASPLFWPTIFVDAAFLVVGLIVAFTGWRR